MQKYLSAIAKGRAILRGEELRCAAPRPGSSVEKCNKLIVKSNVYGQIAGNFRCERCKEAIEVRLLQAPQSNAMSSPRGKSLESDVSNLRFGETQQNQPVEVSPHETYR